MKKRVSVKIGDVFSIKLNQDWNCYGQVVSEGRISDCMIVFDLISMEHPTVSEITTKPIIFLIQTVNSRIEDGYTLVDHKGDIVTETPSASQIEVASELESWSPNLYRVVYVQWSREKDIVQLPLGLVSN